MYPTFDIPPVKSGNTLVMPQMQYVAVDAQGNSTPIDITGYTIQARLLAAGSERLAKEWTTEGDTPSIDMSNAAQGYFTLNSFLATLAVGNYVGDIDFTTPAGIRDTFCNLKLVVVNAY